MNDFMHGYSDNGQEFEWTMDAQKEWCTDEEWKQLEEYEAECKAMVCRLTAETARR